MIGGSFRRGMGSFVEAERWGVARNFGDGESGCFRTTASHETERLQLP